MTKSIIMPNDQETQELLRGSAVLQMELIEALVERAPQPHELASDEASRCKYLSKKCLAQRSTKAKGELHKLCTFHRAKAIVNQRRLEIKKRERSAGNSDQDAANQVPRKRRATSMPVLKRRRTTALQQSPNEIKKPVMRRRRRATAATIMLPAIDIHDVHDLPSGDIATSAKRLLGHKDTHNTPSPRDVQQLEPFRTPATLFPEDLEALRGLVDVEPFTWDFQL